MCVLWVCAWVTLVFGCMHVYAYIYAWYILCMNLFFNHLCVYLVINKWDMYVCACLFMYVYAYMFVCTCGCLACIYNYLYVLIACYSILDLFGEIRTSSPGRRVAARQSRTSAHDGRAGRSPDPRQAVVGDRHGGLPQYPGYPPMQSNSEERHHCDRNGDDQIPQCECLFLLLSFIKWSQLLFYMWCKCWVEYLDYMFMCGDRRAWRWTVISRLFYMLDV